MTEKMAVPFWQWFVSHGDDFFVCAAIVATVLGADKDLPPGWAHWLGDISLISAGCHKVLFPNVTMKEVKP